MNDRFNIANALLVMTFLMSSLHVFGMEKENSIIKLPYEILKLSMCDSRSLQNTVENAASLGATCKYFNKMLSPVRVGKFCKAYDTTEKHQAMKDLLWSMNDYNYWDKRRAASILVYAGVDNAACDSMLRKAIYRKDKQMLALLFENNVNPNQRYGLDPDWFEIENVKIAKIFIARNVDLQAEGNGEPNVLWYIMYQHRSLKLIEFYIQSGVDVKKRDQTGNCILHRLIECSYCYNLSSLRINYVKIAELLLKAAPELINAVNDAGYDPLRYARKRLNDEGEFRKETLNALITFLENYSIKNNKIFFVRVC